MRKRTLLTALLLTSLMLSASGAQAADPLPAPGESAQTAITWKPGDSVTWPSSGALWLSVPLEAGRSVTFAVPKATDIDLLSSPKRAVNGQCAVTEELSCTFLPTGTGTHLLRLKGPAGTATTPLLADGKSATSAYPFGAMRNQRWSLPAAGSAFWQVASPPADSIWAFTVPGATALTLWDGTTKLAEASGTSLRFTATSATALTLEAKVPRPGYYGPALWAEGTAAASGFDWDATATKSFTIGANRTTWVLPDGLLSGRTTQLFLEGSANLAVQTTTGRFLPAPCERSAAGLQCRLIPPAGESVALRLTGAPGAAVKLTARTGTATSPYLLSQLERPERPFQIEPGGQAVLALSLPSGLKLHLRVPDASHLRLQQDASTLITADGEWLATTPPTAGSYPLEVTAGLKGVIQVQRYYPGELPVLAVPFNPTATPFATTIGARKFAWVKVSGLKADQTYQFRSTATLTPTTLDGRPLRGIGRRQEGGFSLTFTPAADGDYLIRLAGAPGPTSLSLSGLSATTPVGPTPDLIPRLSIPAETTAWVSLTIPAAGHWEISVPGATGLTLSLAETEIDAVDADLLIVDAPEAGSYTLAITAGATGIYTPTLIGPGGSQAMALDLPAAGATVKLPSTRSLWLVATGLTGEARYTMKATGNPILQFSGADEKALKAACGTAGSQRICNVTVPADGKLWVRVTGPADLSTVLSLQVQP